MSFILDALKKSESERQRQSGPALFEVKVAPPRSRFAVWAIALSIVLLVNAVVVGWLLLRGPGRRTPAAQAAEAMTPALPAVSAVAAPPSSTGRPSVPAAAPSAEDAQDIAPAVEPTRAPPPPDDGVIQETASGLPTYQDVAARPGVSLPELRLDLLDYSAQPGQSFVDLNEKLLHEGDSLPEGVQVEKIEQDDVILSYRGMRFVLQR